MHPNLTAPALVAEALCRHEGRLSVAGSLMVETGEHTGRSVRDKFVVDEPSVTRDIWWGSINQRYSPEKFAVLTGRVRAYLQGQELFTQDLYAAADPAHRVRVRLSQRTHGLPCSPAICSSGLRRTNWRRSSRIT